MISEAGVATPYESAGELRDVHEHLLEALDDALGPDPTTAAETETLLRLQPRIRQFVERGAATGAYLEEITERTACQTLVDYWASSLARAGAQIGRARLAPFDSARLPELPNEPCPYVGLETFRESNQSVFFGRDDAIEAVLALLRTAPLLVVAGASGSGKSSLVLGGVLPRLKRQDWTPQLRVIPTFVPGTAALEHLAASVRPDPGASRLDIAADVDTFRRDHRHLSTMLGGEAAAPTLIIVDQFEEVFTLCDDKADRQALVATLAQFLKSRPDHRLILTVRAEFESMMREQVLPAFGGEQAWYSIPEMDYEDLRSAIVRPAEAVNLHIRPQVVDHLVKRVIGQPAALPLLQFTLRSLWDARDRNRITTEVYNRVGGDPLVVLANSAKAFLDRHKDPETLDEIKRLLLALVRVDDRLETYRQPVAKSRLLKTGKANTPDVLRLLETADFVRITPEVGGDDAVVEVKHESLVRNWPELATWIGEKRDLFRRRLALTDAAAQWARSGKPKSDGLLTGSLLTEAANQPDRSVLEEEYVRASGAAADKTRRRYRAVAAAAVLFAIIVVLGGAYFLRQQLENDKRTRLLYKLIENLQGPNLADDRTNLGLVLTVEIARRSQANGSAADETDKFRSLLISLTENPELTGFYTGHSKPVRAVKFSPDGRVFASASEDGTISLRDVRTGGLLRAPWQAHSDAIYSLAFSPDGKTLASAGDTTVRLWNVDSGKEEHVLRHLAKVNGVAISPKDGALLAVACEDGTIALWDVASWTRRPSLPHSQATHSQRSAVYHVAFTPDGALLASGGKDGRIVFWDVATGTQKGEPIKASPQPVFSMAISHDGKTIASGHSDGNVYLWSVETGKRLTEFSHNHRGVYGIAFSPDDSQLVTASRDRRLEVHTLVKVGPKAEQLIPMAATKRNATGIMSGVRGPFYSVDFNKEGVFATGTFKGGIAVWDVTRPARFGRYVRSVEGVMGTAFTADGQTLVLHSQDSLTFRPVASPVADLSLAETGRSVTAGQTGIRLAIAGTNGEELLTVGWDNSIKRWEWDPVKLQHSVETLVPPGKAEITAAAYAAERRTLLFATYNAEHETRIWRVDLPAGKPRLILEPFRDMLCQALAVTPKANLLAISLYGVQEEVAYRTSLWRLDPVAEVGTLATDPVLDLAFNHDGKRLASGHNDGAIRLWDTEAASDKPLATLGGHVNSVTSVAFSPDGRWLASGSTDKTVLLWDVATGQPLSRPLDVTVNDEYFSYYDKVQVAFSPDGRFLASNAFERDGTGPGISAVMLWDLRVPMLLDFACRTAGRNMTSAEWRDFFGDEAYRITCPWAAADEADAAALQGDKAGAEKKFAEAWGAVLAMGDLGQDPELANHVCWSGSTDGFAATVKDSCDKAVEWAAPAVADLYRDSQGLARALTGDRLGAADDFEAVLKYLNREPGRGGYGAAFVHRREEWIAALRNGKDPFDTKLLNALRTEAGDETMEPE